MKIKISPEEVLNYHEDKKPGKFEIRPSKPLLSVRDLSLAYTPGVALPCLEIQKDPSAAYIIQQRKYSGCYFQWYGCVGVREYRGFSIEARMEEKSILFKKFTVVENIDEFVNCVKYLGASFGGINLEDIKAPEYFVIEERLKASMDSPFFMMINMEQLFVYWQDY